MTNSTLLLIVLSLFAAAGLSYYQYFFKAGARSKVSLLLAFLRFASVFSLLLLLINPIITRETFETQKAPLALLVDNSASVRELGGENAAREVYSKISGHQGLREKFDIKTYAFDEEFLQSDKFTFKGKQTNIDRAAKSLAEAHRNTVFPTVLISDGNQTHGTDYAFSFDPANKVYPIVLGDTAVFPDLKISRLNVNKYAFSKNKFPVEVFIQYSGSKPVTANFNIKNQNNVIAQQTVLLSGSKRSAVVNLLLPAGNPGLQVFKASVSSALNEKNTYNNVKNFAVEIIDQRSEVAIVSAINHPDLGALKRAIESNAQRKVTILKPSEFSSASNFNVVIAYQPTSAFAGVFESRSNIFVVTGNSTDFNWLNSRQKIFTFRMSSQSEDYIAGFDTGFNLFAADDINFGSLPPLEHPYGTATAVARVEVLLGSRIRNIATNSPMLSFSENGGRRFGFLFGENIWKWRLQTHVDNKSFEKFDIFIDKAVQFLSSDSKRRSLVVNSESFYNSGDAIEITAQYFNKNYEFDQKARLSIVVTNRLTKARKNYELLRGENVFKASLDGLAAGKYDYTVKELSSNTAVSGYFEVLDFDIEKQFVNPDVIKLSEVASGTSGKLFLARQSDELIKLLMDDKAYLPVQKAVIKRTPLIDWIWLLVILSLALSLEWFIRKYNGML